MPSTTSSGVTLIGAFTSVATGATSDLPLVREKYGVFKVADEIGDITTWRVNFEGSMDGVTFFRLVQLTQASKDANGSTAALVMLFPFVRARVTVFTGGGDGAFICYLQE